LENRQKRKNRLPLILIVSNIGCEERKDLQKMFPAGSACVVTASELNKTFKTAVSFDRFGSSEIALEGAKIAANQITGVISTISNFLPQEFFYIDPTDREYVCAETNAFFTYFLSELSCKKVNPPSPRSLSGYYLHPVEWAQIAMDHHVPVRPVIMKNGILTVADQLNLGQPLRATMVGERMIEKDIPESVQHYMSVLSKTFEMPYLSCFFVPHQKPGEYFLVDISFIPDISSPGHREAIVSFLTL
jgi:hypothetical protein